MTDLDKAREKDMKKRTSIPWVFRVLLIAPWTVLIGVCIWRAFNV